MFQSFTVLSALSVWAARPATERAKALRSYLVPILAKPDVTRAIGEALPDSARKPFNEFVLTLENEWKV